MGQSCEIGLNYYNGIAHSQGFEVGSNGLSLNAHTFILFQGNSRSRVEWNWDHRLG